MSSQNKELGSTRSGVEMIEQDKISDLPRSVIGRILSRLPIKDMVRTSVLSTKWRYRWTAVSILVFDDQSFPRSSDCDRVVDRILLLHSGPIHKFKLYYDDIIPFEKIDKWILDLSRRSIKELDLRISELDYYSNDYYISPSLFSCHELTHLDLNNCSLSLPPAFEGFENLKSLTLERVITIQQHLELLISSSPLLERLNITEVRGVDQLNIRGLNLLFFDIGGKFVDVCIKSASHLAELYITAMYRNARFEVGNFDEYGDFMKLMASIPQISCLRVGGCLLRFIAAGNIPRELPIPCINLTFLSISVLFASFNEVSALLCLLKSAPNLEELQINSYLDIGEAVCKVWEWDANGLERPFTRLQLVSIDYFTGTEIEMGFVEFVLLASPALESMIIELDKYRHFEGGYNKSNFEILENMLSFKCASTEVEIDVREWSE